MNQQEIVRAKLKEKTYAMRRENISKGTGIPKEMISRFMHGQRDLYESSLIALNEYLDNC